MTGRFDSLADRCLVVWNAHRATLVPLATWLAIGVAVPWLAYQLWRLLWGAEPIWPGSPLGGIDLINRRNELGHWFEATDRPFRPHPGYYPPASYAMLWPLLGWPPMAVVRVGWAAVCLVGTWWLIATTLRATGPWTGPPERRFLFWMPLSMYATGATIGNGQHILHVLPMTLAAVLMVSRGPARMGQDLAVAALFVGALFKPHVAAPFFWLLITRSGRLRPAVLTVLGYAALTAVALMFRPIELAGYLDSFDWSTRMGSSARVGDLGMLLGTLGLGRWAGVVTLAMVAGLGLWLWRRRHAPLWPTLAVTAIVTRLLMYHRWYDDLMMLVPLIALYRIAGQAEQPARRCVAGLLFVALWLTLLAPGTVYVLPPPYNAAAGWLQTALWLAVLAYLTVLIERAARGAGSAGSCIVRVGTGPQGVGPETDQRPDGTHTEI